MKTKIIVVAGALGSVVAAGCAIHRNVDASAAAHEAAGAVHGRVIKAGAPLRKDARPVRLRVALEHPDDYRGDLLRLRGKIDAVCPMRGCWLILDDGGARARVTFKDYGFFVPTDSAGKHIRMDGRVVRQTISRERAMHLESETEGGDPESISGPQEIISIVATGVEISEGP